MGLKTSHHPRLEYNKNKYKHLYYFHLNSFRYTRNLVDEGNGKFNLIIICWGEGHSSAIHDHSNSHCFMKILQGELCEIRYDWPCKQTKNSDSEQGKTNSEQEIKETSHSILELDRVCYINDYLGLHRIQNSSHTNTAVSLHLYCPPFNSCKVFNRKTGKSVKCPVTFWSSNGKRMKCD